MLLSELVEVSGEVAATRARSRKLDLLSTALAALDTDEIAAGVAFLAGEPRQQRLELGPAAVFGLTSEPTTSATLTVPEVDGALQAIADVAPGSGSRTRRLDLLAGLLERATTEEQTWLRSLVLRELRQGALEGLLLQAVARAAGVDERAVRRAAMLTGDLREVADVALHLGEQGLAGIRLEVGVPLQPMLASPAPDLETVLVDLGGIVLEAKLDGARIQVHRVEDDVTVYTRNLREVSARLPEVVGAVRALPVSTVVLDGEAMTFDAAGRPRAFQETMQRFGRDHEPEAVEEIVVEARFFDLLHLDGDDVLDRPLRERLDALGSIVPDRMRVDQLRTSDPVAARDFLRRTLAGGDEGVMAKDPDAPYEAGRRGAAWRKVKPVHTLDLVVLAAEWGSGRRRGWLSNLHLGARADDGEGFVMLGKTFKGLTDEVLDWQTEQLLTRETHREGHIVHVRPELVVEIASDGVLRSPRYAGGLALRFARLRGYRPDKDAADADSLDTVRAIHEGRRAPGT